MLDCFTKAHGVTGRKKTDIAREMEISPQALHSYLTGRQYVPPKRRAAMSRAFGAEIDWEAYEAQVKANDPPKIKAAGMPGADANRPAPAKAPQKPASAGGWGQKPSQTPTPAKAPAAAPPAAQEAPKRGFLSGLISDGKDYLA